MFTRDNVFILSLIFMGLLSKDCGGRIVTHISKDTFWEYIITDETFPGMPDVYLDTICVTSINEIQGKKFFETNGRFTFVKNNNVLLTYDEAYSLDEPYFPIKKKMSSFYRTEVFKDIEGDVYTTKVKVTVFPDLVSVSVPAGVFKCVVYTIDESEIIELKNTKLPKNVFYYNSQVGIVKREFIERNQVVYKEELNQFK